MELNNLSNCEQNCSKKCYIKLEDGTLVRKLCKEAIGKIFNDCDEIIKREIEKRNISIEKFYELRDSKVKFDNDENKKNAATIREIREAIPSPNENDIFEKAIPKLSFYKYIETTGKISRFVTLAKYISKLKTPDDYIKNLALNPQRFTPDNPMYIMRFTFLNPSVLNPSDKGGKLDIPFNKEGEEPQGDPCTGSGFTASNNDNNCPEYYISSDTEMQEGSQVFDKNWDGSEELIEVLDRSSKQFVPYDGDIIIKIGNEFFKKYKDGNVTPTEIDESTTDIIDLLP